MNALKVCVFYYRITSCWTVHFLTLYLLNDLCCLCHYRIVDPLLLTFDFDRMAVEEPQLSLLSTNLPAH